MPFDTRQAGFAWPEEMELTNVRGERMTIRPHAANLFKVQAAGKDRGGQCYRYYTSERGILTELEVFYWYAGGQQVVSSFLTGFKGLFDQQRLTRLPLSGVVDALAGRGFDETTIRICLRWLLQDGYVAIESTDEGRFLEIVKW